MSRKPGDNSQNGFADVIGIALLALALLLLVAQLSFDRSDLPYARIPPNREIHNWIGTIGAHLAWFAFLPLGVPAYLLPWMLAAFGSAFLLNFPAYLRERPRWMLLWTAILFVSLTGLVHLLDIHNLAGYAREYINTNSAGGFVGWFSFKYGFRLLGNLGATIVYASLGLISLLFLTNFQLGGWIRALWHKENAAPEDEFKSAEEIALEKRALELEKQKRKLEEQVGRSEKTGSGLGADGLPVPEPTVRDLSVPQPKGPRVRKTTLSEPPKEVTPVEDPLAVGEVIPASEIKPATTDDILGRKSDAKPAEKKPVEASSPEPVVAEKVEAENTGVEKPAEPKLEPVITIADGSAPPPPRPKLMPRKPKPMTVASVPMIGNYQLPPMDFLQHADMTVKPTESKEELMANARLMQQTLAQFDIEVSLGDITKGPTITRYELHPAPGVKL